MTWELIIWHISTLVVEAVRQGYLSGETSAATSSLVWATALVAAAIDSLLIAILSWQIKRSEFRQLQPALLVVALLYWCALYVWAFNTFWDDCYGYALPDRIRSVALFYGIAAAALGSLFWWLASKLPGNPFLWFALMAGVHSLPGHLYAIFGRRLLQLCPLLTGVSPAAALVFGVFEFILYWNLVLVLAAAINRRRRAKTVDS